MEFTVPKFVEREPRIIGQVTFKQFIFLVVVGGGIGLMYLLVQSTFLFYLIAVPVVGLAAAVVFVRINGRPFGIVMINFFRYTINSKMFLWKRKQGSPRLMQKIAKEEQKDEMGGDTLKIHAQSHLQNMARKIETE